MAKRVAMHVIRRMTEPGKRASKPGERAVRPKYEEIQPGTLFEVSGDELADLEKAGAVVMPSDKRAARFGFGTEVGAALVEQEEGETADSANRRRRTASRTAATGAEPTRTRRTSRRKDADLVG